MKTLRVTLEDILGPVGPSHGQTSTEVWARYVDGSGPAHLVTTDGAVVTSAARRVALSSEGVADIEVYASDDADIDPDFHGFGIEVGWGFRVRGVHGRDADVRGSGVVQVLNASTEVEPDDVVMFGDLDPFEPVTPIGGGGGVTTEEVQDIIGAMVTAAGGTYDDGAGSITLPSGGGGGAPTGAAGGDLAGTYPNPTVVAASTTVAGKVELATSAEATTGTDTARAVTPAGARAAGDARYVRTVNGTAPDGAGNVAVSGGASLDVAVAAVTTNYTVVLGDAHKAVEVNSATPVSVTVPLNATVAFPIGTLIEVYQRGAGQVTVAATGGVTVESRGALVALAGQYAVASLRKRSTDTWVLTGDLA